MARQCECYDAADGHDLSPAHDVDGPMGVTRHPDKRCAAFEGVQGQGKFVRVYRVDMDDQTGLLMCERCADDAMESGLFTTERE